MKFKKLLNERNFKELGLSSPFSFSPRNFFTSYNEEDIIEQILLKGKEDSKEFFLSSFSPRNFFTSYNEEDVNDSYVVVVLTSKSRPWLWRESVE